VDLVCPFPRRSTSAGGSAEWVWILAFNRVRVAGQSPTLYDNDFDHSLGTQLLVLPVYFSS
jgi:hypothetical protein